MKLEPRISLVFNGTCDEAFEFYQRCLGATVTFRLTWGESPMAGGAPPEWREKVLHATVAIGDRRISGIDLPPDQYERPRGFQIDLNLDDVAAAQRIFAEFAQDGQVTVPLQQTFWAKQFGAVVDLFGIPWAINCE